MRQIEFNYTTAIPYESGVTRRDPSPVVELDGMFYVWYSKATVDPSGYFASVWYATSSDGHDWTEQGEAIPKGGSGAWDENGVFTPTILVAEGKYHLFYTAVPKPFDNDNGGPNSTPTAIGTAVAEHPDGPWVKFEENPVLTPGPEDAWDSHRVDDACFVVREGKYWLYFKGRQRGLSPRETKMGVAMADQPTGPYVKYEGNPILMSGHEVCVWPHGTGVGALIAPTGPDGSTLRYAADGLRFEKIADIKPPHAPGPFRADRFMDAAGPGISWGISHASDQNRPYLVRFECDLEHKNEPESR